MRRLRTDWGTEENIEANMVLLFRVYVLSAAGSVGEGIGGDMGLGSHGGSLCAESKAPSVMIVRVEERELHLVVVVVRGVLSCVEWGVVFGPIEVG